jgi:CheY-like chemotaxis protein
MSYRLDRLSILLVEDSDIIRKLLFSILRSLDVGQIHTARNGQEAIDFLVSRSRSGLPGQAPVDLILSDLVMSPTDGAMLLRWVRRSDDSPDRFMPFVMISGAVDRKRVQEVRDLGVSEFLAKPFSIAAVAAHLQAAIENPRQFVRRRIISALTGGGPARNMRGRTSASPRRTRLPCCIPRGPCVPCLAIRNAGSSGCPTG